MTRSHVTAAEAHAVAEFAADLCTALNMPGWTVLVMTDPCDDDAYATIDWVEGKHTARLSLSPEWMKLTDDQRRETITHEVLHLLHFRVSIAAFDDSQHLMQHHEHEDWARRVRRELEYMVDHLAVWMSRTHGLTDSWNIAHGKATP